MVNVRFRSLLAVFAPGLLALAPAAGCWSDPLEAPGSEPDTPRLLARDLAAAPGCADHADPDQNDEDDPALRALASRPLTWRKPGPRIASHRTVRIKLLGLNDFHGQLAGRTVAGRPAGGAAVLAAYLREASRPFPGRAAIVHAGDLVGASPPSSALLQDEPTIQVFNLLTNRHCRYSFRGSPFCNLVGTPGNHEFDEGRDELLRLLYGGNHPNGPFLEADYRGARYPNISANVVDEDTGQTLLPPLAVKILGGIPVGFVGAVLEATPTIVTPTGVEGLAFLDEAEAINRQVRTLKRLGIRTIVVTIHQGGMQTSFEGPTPEGPASQVSGEIVDIVSRLDGEVDVVVSGHTHSFTNALLPSSSGEPVLATQSFSASTAFGDIDLVVDRRTRDVVEKSARIVTTFADVEPGTTPAGDVAEIVARAEELTAPLVNQVVAESADVLTREQNAAGESRLGNLIADAQRAAMGTDFAFMNPGGIRADLDAGDATWGEFFTIQPFGNSLVSMTLSGQQVIGLLEQQWLGQSSRRILAVSGLSYTWSAAQPDGQRIARVLVAGRPIDPAAPYTVTANSFLAAGGDNFTILVEGTDRVGGPIDLDALIEYTQSLPQPFTAAIEGRIQTVP